MAQATAPTLYSTFAARNTALNLRLLLEVLRKHRDRRLGASPSRMTHCCQSTANFAVVHNGPHDVVVYGRRPMGGLGETALRYEP